MKPVCIVLGAGARRRRKRRPSLGQVGIEESYVHRVSCYRRVQYVLRSLLCAAGTQRRCMTLGCPLDGPGTRKEAVLDTVPHTDKMGLK